MISNTVSEFVLKRIPEQRKQQIISNIARNYCLLEIRKINNKNIYSAKLTNRTKVEKGQLLVDAKEARKILKAQG